MIAIVVDAKKPGVTGWAAVRSTRELVVRGLDDGEILINYSNDNGFDVVDQITANCRVPLPEQATRVKVEIVKVKESRIFVDLE